MFCAVKTYKNALTRNCPHKPETFRFFFFVPVSRLIENFSVASSNDKGLEPSIYIMVMMNTSTCTHILRSNRKNLISEFRWH